MASSKRTTGSPAFQFYPKDFLSSSKVQRMSLTEIGAYIVLLSHAWLSGSIPSNEAEIAKLVKMPTVRFKRMWAGALSECFTKRGSVLVNERLDMERRKQIEYRRRQSDHGRKGGRRVPFANPQGFAVASPSTRDCKQEISSSSQVLLKEEQEGVALDGAFAAFQRAYPPARVKGGYPVQTAFVDQVVKAGSAQALLDALANHKASEQWSEPKLIPGMDVWLREERWRQRLEPKGTRPAPLSARTAGNAEALKRFAERGRTA